MAEAQPRRGIETGGFMTSFWQCLLTPPEQVSRASTYGLPLAHMAYQLGQDGQLRQRALPHTVSGGLMLVGGGACSGDARRAVRALLSVCRTRSFGGIILDIEAQPNPFWCKVIPELDEALKRQSKRFFLPETYANYSAHASLFLSSALSGGSLHARLETAVQAYGAERLVLALHRAGEDFPLPCPNGIGTPLTQQELQDRIQRFSPHGTFFSAALCARYFTYMVRGQGAHFILFDDGESLCKKRSVAEKLGIRQFFLLYPAVEDLMPMLLPPAASP